MANKRDAKKNQPTPQPPAQVVERPTPTGTGEINDLRTQLKEITKRFQEEPSPWVNGTAIGFQPDGQTAKKPRIVFFVDPGAPKCELSAIKERVGPEVKVLRVSRFLGLQSPNPAQPGDSASTYDPFRYNLPPVNAGTLGARVAARDGRNFILGSNHVLAHNGRALAGTPITSPGVIDSLTAGPIIAGRSDFVPLQFAAWPYLWPSQGPVNTVDCGLAAIAQGVTIDAPTQVALLPSLTLLTVSDLIALSQTKLIKRGRATGRKESQIAFFDLRTYIGFTFSTCYFEGLIGTFDATPSPLGSPPIFAAPGDSGSVAVIDPSTPGKFSGSAVGVVTARAYVFDDSDQFVAYIIAMCPMDSVVTELAKELKLNKDDLTVFMRFPIPP